MQKLNVAKTNLDSASEFALKEFSKSKKFFYDEIPNFDNNYLFLQERLSLSRDIPRYMMPVIEPKDFNKFKEKIKSGHIDLFAPFASTNLFPEEFKTKRHQTSWLTLGLKDGKIEDDVLKADIIEIPASGLIPIQSQIWFDKLIKYTLMYGVPRQGSKVLKTPIIISRDFNIIDGHHRWGQVMLANPALRMQALYIPLDVDTLLKMSKSYGVAIGNSPQW